MKTILILIIFSALVITGCQFDATTDSSEDAGMLVVKVTDAPFPIEEVVRADVHIVKIDIRGKMVEGEDSTSFMTIMEGDTVFNLLQLRNGATADFPALEIPQGKYDLVRLYTSEAEIELEDGRVFNMKIPSGPQTGIKIFIKPMIEIVGTLTSELLLDFDMTKSFTVQGNPKTPAGIKGFHFKPVIRATNNSTAGRIVGSVMDTSTTPIANAEVWVEQDTVVSTSYSDSSGLYGLIGLPAGSYSLFAAKEGYDTVSVSDFNVTSANQIIHNFELIPE